MAKQIQYSRGLLTDFHKLIQEFFAFMNWNLMHADLGLQAPCGDNMRTLIKHSVEGVKIMGLADFFRQPLLRFEQENKAKLIANITNVTKFFYDYLVFAEPILQACRPDLYRGRFAQVKAAYVAFGAKYLA